MIAPDENETKQKIVDVMTQGMELPPQKYGRSVRISHAKAHALFKGELIVESSSAPAREPAVTLDFGVDLTDVFFRLLNGGEHPRAPGKLMNSVWRIDCHPAVYVPNLERLDRMSKPITQI